MIMNSTAKFLGRKIIVYRVDLQRQNVSKSNSWDLQNY